MSDGPGLLADFAAATVEQDEAINSKTKNFPPFCHSKAQCASVNLASIPDSYLKALAKRVYLFFYSTLLIPILRLKDKCASFLPICQTKLRNNCSARARPGLALSYNCFFLFRTTFQLVGLLLPSTVLHRASDWACSPKFKARPWTLFYHLLMFPFTSLDIWLFSSCGTHSVHHRGRKGCSFRIFLGLF